MWHPSVEGWEMFEGRQAGRALLPRHAPAAGQVQPRGACSTSAPACAGGAIPEAALVCNLPGGERGRSRPDGARRRGDVLPRVRAPAAHAARRRQRWVGSAASATEHDFVEAPSQMLEEWAAGPAGAATFARHHETGEPIPTELVEQLRARPRVRRGRSTCARQMVYARHLAVALRPRPGRGGHRRDRQGADRGATSRIPPMPGTHLQASFGHLDGYSACYYTYMWSLVIAKDLFSRFDPSDLLDAGAGAALPAPAPGPGRLGAGGPAGGGLSRAAVQLRRLAPLAGGRELSARRSAERALAQRGVGSGCREPRVEPPDPPGPAAEEREHEREEHQVESLLARATSTAWPARSS